MASMRLMKSSKFQAWLVKFIFGETGYLYYKTFFSSWIPAEILMASEGQKHEKHIKHEINLISEATTIFFCAVNKIYKVPQYLTRVKGFTQITDIAQEPSQFSNIWKIPNSKLYENTKIKLIHFPSILIS